MEGPTKDKNSDQLAPIETHHTSATRTVEDAPELTRNFRLLSLTGLGLVVGDVWPASGGTVLVAVFNSGPPG